MPRADYDRVIADIDARIAALTAKLQEHRAIIVETRDALYPAVETTTKPTAPARSEPPPRRDRTARRPVGRPRTIQSRKSHLQPIRQARTRSVSGAESGDPPPFDPVAVLRQHGPLTAAQLRPHAPRLSVREVMAALATARDAGLIRRTGRGGTIYDLPLGETPKPTPVKPHTNGHPTSLGAHLLSPLSTGGHRCSRCEREGNLTTFGGPCRSAV